MVLADLNGDGVSAAAKELGVGENAVPFAMDVTGEEQWREVVRLAVERFGKVDILVNNGATGD